MPFLKEGEIRRRKKCSEHLKELDRNAGETEVDQTDADPTDANPGTDYKDICWQDGRRIGELKTLAEQLNACDGCDTPLNLMNIEQERLYGFGSYLSIRCTTIAVLFHLFHSFQTFSNCSCWQTSIGQPVLFEYGTGCEWHQSNQTLQCPVVTIRYYPWSAGSWQVFPIVGLCVFSHQSADYIIVVAHLTSNSFEGHPCCMHAD